MHTGNHDSEGCRAPLLNLARNLCNCERCIKVSKIVIQTTPNMMVLKLKIVKLLL